VVSHIADSVQRARSLGSSPEAARLWRELLGQTHVDEADYSDWARELASIYNRTNRGLAAARIHEYLLAIQPATDLYRKHGTQRDVGRVQRLGKQHAQASESYREGGLYGHAAKAAEEHGDKKGALALFEQLERSYEAQTQPYLAGLAALNGGRLARDLKDKERQNHLLATATRLLEQSADEKESTGDRDAAFRSYQCLVEIGKIEGSYENLAEGYLNCIRILKAKSDRFFTMQYYYDFVAFSEELGEVHSVAELYREAGEYARRVGFIYGDYFLLEAAKAWRRVAVQGLERGNPPELVENSLLAAIACFNRVEDDRGVAECYASLAELALVDSKVQRYKTLAAEMGAEAVRVGPSEPPPAFPEYFRRRVRMPEIWTRDILEAESGRDIPDAIGRLVGDHKNVWEVQRRRALLISLAYDDHVRAGGDSASVPTAIIESIGELNHSAAVPPLLALYESGDENLRALILEKTASLKQREYFALIDRALKDTSERVREAGTAALRRATFAQALDSLVRIFNTFAEPEVKEACLRSVAAIGTDEACEFLLDVIRSHPSTLGQRARALLEKGAQERMLSALERNRRREPDPSLRLFIGRLVENIRSRRGSMNY
jgi:tetratricopeptide (TPR) repeat protein